MSVISENVRVGYFDETEEYKENELISGKYYKVTILAQFENSDNDDLVFNCDNGNDELNINVEDICNIEEI